MTAQVTIGDAALLMPRRLAVSNDAAALAVLAQAAAATGWAALEACGHGITGAATAIASGSPAALIIVDIDGEADVFAGLARLADACLAETRVLAIGSRNDIALFKALLAQGIGDYLVKPLQPAAVAAALGRAQAVVAPVPAAAGGRVVAVLGVRGGCGATTLATSLAWLIAGASEPPLPNRCILVDFDLHHGTAALALGIEPGPASGSGLAAMLANPDRLDAQLIAANLQPVGNGAALGIIAAQTPIEQEAPVSPAAATALLAALRTTAPWIIADLPRGLDAASRQLLRTADQVLLVSPPSLEGLRDSGRLLAWLRALRAGAPPLIVVNGANAGASGEIGRRLFEETLGQPVTAWVPALCGPAAAAAAHALPLAALAGGPAGNPFADLAALVTGTAPPRAPPRLWSRLRSRWWPK
jgi:pilus assembly protein CpaE